MYYTQKSENKVYAALLFLIWPFFAVFIALYQYKQTWAKNIVWFFVAFYGYTMVIGNDGIDASRYRAKFIEMAESSTTTNVFTDLYAKDSDNVDLLSPLLTKTVSMFTNNYKMLFLVYGLVFGYFFSRNLWLLLDRVRYRITLIHILLLILFFIINPIWNINGFRFYAAAQIFVYGCLTYFLDGKRKGVFIAATAVLAHFSFLLPLLIYVLYRFLGNKLTMYFYFFLVSLFITELNLESVRESLLVISPVVFEDRIEGYTNEAYKESIVDRFNESRWYLQFKIDSLKYSIYVFLIVLYWRGKYIYKRNKKLYKLFCFILLFYGISSIISYVPSAGRFIEVASGFAIALLFLCLQFRDDKLINNIIKMASPALLLYLLMTIRLGLDTMGITTILGNPLIALFIEDDIPLINLIK